MRPSWLASHAGPRRSLDRIDNGLIAGAAAVIARQMLAQEVRQVESRQNMRVDAFTVDFERDWQGGRHTGPPAAGRPRSAEAQRASNIFARCRRMAADAC